MGKKRDMEEKAYLERSNIMMRKNIKQDREITTFLEVGITMMIKE